MKAQKNNKETSSHHASGDGKSLSLSPPYLLTIEERIARLERVLGLSDTCQQVTGRYFDRFEFKQAIEALALKRDKSLLNKYIKKGGIIKETE